MGRRQTLPEGVERGGILKSILASKTTKKTTTTTSSSPPDGIRKRPEVDYAPHVNWWEQNPDRKTALNLYFMGRSILQIATQLEYDRKTIAAWVRDSRFVAKLEERIRETRQQRQLQRLHGISKVASYFQAKTSSAIDEEMREEQEVQENKRDPADKTDRAQDVALYLKHYATARAEERSELQTTEDRVRDDMMRYASVTEVTETSVVHVISRTLGDQRMREIDADLGLEFGAIEEGGGRGEQEKGAILPRSKFIGLLEETLDHPEVLSGFHQDYEDLAGLTRKKQTPLDALPEEENLNDE